MSYLPSSRRARLAPTRGAGTVALGSTDYRDGKIPGDGVETVSWENPSFTWWNDPFGNREERYLRDRAAYYAKLKAAEAAKTLTASAQQTLEALNAAFDAAKHGGIAQPGSPPVAFVPPNTTPLVGGVPKKMVALAAIGLVGAGAFLFLKRRQG